MRISDVLPAILMLSLFGCGLSSRKPMPWSEFQEIRKGCKNKSLEKRKIRELVAPYSHMVDNTDIANVNVLKNDGEIKKFSLFFEVLDNGTDVCFSAS